MVKPKPPAAPVLQPTASPPVVRTAPDRSAEPFAGPVIPLDIPAKVKSKIQSEVRVGVLVAIDREGNVTGARIAATKGGSAHFLLTEALRAARQARFRPAREGEKAVASQMVLTFLFKPDSNQF